MLARRTLTAAAGLNVAGGGGGGGTAVSFVASASTTSENTGDTTISVTKPTGTTEGDLLVAFINTRNSIPSDNGPEESGWKRAFVAGVGSGGLGAPSSGNEFVEVWYKVAGASEPSSYTFLINDDGTDGQSLHMLTFRDAGPYITIVDAVGGSLVAPSLTASDGDMLVCFYGTCFDSGSFDSAPPDMTEAESTDAGTSDVLGYSAYQAITSAGATGTKTVGSTAVDDFEFAISLLVRPPSPTTGFAPLSDISWKAAFWADDPSWSNPGDGNAVSSWRDAGSEAANATQATGAQQPTFRSSTVAFNNRATVEFDGGDDLGTGNWGTGISSVASVFMVAAVDSTAATGHFFDGNDIANRSSVYVSSTGPRWRTYAGTEQSGRRIADTSPHFFAATWDGSTSEDPLWVDGNMDSFLDAGSQTLDGLVLGATYLISANLDGHIAFLAVKDGAWADYELEDLYAWAESYYGL